MPLPEQLPASEQGIEQARSQLDDFDRLLYSRAETLARQRGAARIDDADFTSAYRDLLATERRGWQFWTIRVGGSALILIGGISLSYSISNWSATTGAPTMILMVGGVCAVAGLAFQHLPFRFR